MLWHHEKQFSKTHKQTGALSCFKSRERSKGDSITFDLKRDQKDKFLDDILRLKSQKDQMTTQDDLGKKDYQVTMNYRIPPGESRSTGRWSPWMMYSLYHVYKAVDSASYA